MLDLKPFEDAVEGLNKARSGVAILNLTGWLGERAHYLVDEIKRLRAQQVDASDKLTPGEPCDHPGCAQHFSHPCEGCGRIACR